MNYHIIYLTTSHRVVTLNGMHLPQEPRQSKRQALDKGSHIIHQPWFYYQGGVL